MIKLKNLYEGLKAQGPWKRAFKNFFITKDAWGLFHKNSHINRSTGKLKVTYGSKSSAEKAALSLEKKRGVHFSVYKCIFCDGWHIGRNQSQNII